LGIERDDEIDWPWHDVLRWVESETQRARRRYGLATAEVDDVRQQICLRVIKSLRRFDPETGKASLETWVRRQAAWGVADYWRERVRTDRRLAYGDHDGAAVDPDAAPDRRASRNELRDALEGCLANLTEKQRRRFLGTRRPLDARASISRFARMRGVSRDSVKESVVRALVQLRRCLASRGFAPTAWYTTREAVAVPRREAR